MLSKRKFHQTAELGVAVAAMTALVLVGCGGGSSSSGTGAAAGGTSAALSAYITDALAGNIWSWHGSQYQNASGVMVAAGASASKSLLTQTATANTYTRTSLYHAITLPGAWAVQPSNSYTTYVLTSTGWGADTGTVLSNGTSVSFPGQSSVITLAKTDLSGQAVACTSPMGSDLAGPANYYQSPIIKCDLCRPYHLPIWRCVVHHD